MFYSKKKSLYYIKVFFFFFFFKCVYMFVSVSPAWFMEDTLKEIAEIYFY